MASRIQGRQSRHASEFLDDNGLLYRVFSPSPGARDDYLLLSLKRDAAAVTNHPELKLWAEAGAYAFAVLFETEGRLKRFKRRFDSEPGFPLQVHLALVPGPHRLAQAIRQRQNRQLELITEEGRGLNRQGD